jgi:hypothetical protein
MKSVIIAALLPLVMCGGKSDNSLNPQTPASDLSVEQLQAVCDWEAGLLGGYNQPLICEGGAPSIDPGFHEFDGPVDRASCVTNLSNRYQMCPVTMQQLEICLKWSIEVFCTATIPMPASCATYFSAQCKG